MLNRFLGCLSVVFTIPSAASKPVNWEQLRFVVCVNKSKLVNSNVPHFRSLASVSCIEIIVQIKIYIIILSSVRSNKHMMALLCERI